MYNHCSIWATIQVKMCSAAAIQHLHSVTGVGSVNRKQVVTTGLRPIYSWTVSKTAAVPLLKELLPYLVVKAKQAEVFIDLITNLKSMNRGTEEDVVEQEVERRLLLIQYLKDLKKEN